MNSIPDIMNQVSSIFFDRPVALKEGSSVKRYYVMGDDDDTLKKGMADLVVTELSSTSSIYSDIKSKFGTYYIYGCQKDKFESSNLDISIPNVSNNRMARYYEFLEDPKFHFGFVEELHFVGKHSTAGMVRVKLKVYYGNYCRDEIIDACFKLINSSLFEKGKMGCAVVPASQFDSILDKDSVIDPNKIEVKSKGPIIGFFNNQPIHEWVMGSVGKLMFEGVHFSEYSLKGDEFKIDGLIYRL